MASCIASLASEVCRQLHKVCPNNFLVVLFSIIIHNNQIPVKTFKWLSALIRLVIMNTYLWLPIFLQVSTMLSTYHMSDRDSTCLLIFNVCCNRLDVSLRVHYSLSLSAWKQTSESHHCDCMTNIPGLRGRSRLPCLFPLLCSAVSPPSKHSYEYIMLQNKQ